jgi:hypothetical protein
LLEGADEQTLGLRQGSALVGDIQHALTLCGGIVQAVSCETVAGGAGDDTQ